jgi:ABC-2 type transport system permease protein
MIRNILILTFNDLAISFKNKTLYLILFIPLFVFVSLNLVDDGEPSARKIKIGLVENASYPPAMIQAFSRPMLSLWFPGIRTKRKANCG